MTAIAVAILINEIRKKTAKKLYQSLILLPYLMSWVIVSYLAFTFLSAETGMFNKGILEPLGHAGINWYQEKKYWPFILVFVTVWKGIGYSMIIYLSSIVGISVDYFEAARIDGATDARVFFSVSLPLAKVGLVSVILFMALQYWNDFYLSLYLITKTDLYTLQKLLYNMMANISALLTNSSLQSAKEHIVLPSNTARMAMTVFTVLPVLVFYPFAQKYFVKGITVGAVKG